MKHTKILYLLTSVFVVSICPAYADCFNSPFSYGNLSGNPTVSSQVVTDGANCIHLIRFTSATNDSNSIVTKPKNGDLKTVNAYTIEYTPKKNFKGNDAYTAKFCGTERTGSAGCVTVDYVVTVK